MEGSFYIRAIVLQRDPFRERDSRVIVYSLEQGKLELVARGTAKILSKLAGHLEPLNLVELMVVKGRQLDYVGAVTSAASFPNIKSDLEKIFLVGGVIKQFNLLIKENEVDPAVFYLLQDFLVAENIADLKSEQIKLLAMAFLIKLIKLLGYEPDLSAKIIYERVKDKTKLVTSAGLIKNYSLLTQKSFSEVLKINFSQPEITELDEFVTYYILANIK
jgi:DNA repair protein RecO (recombination protein O)